MSLVRTWARRSAGSGSGQLSWPARCRLACWRRGLQIALGLIWLRRGRPVPADMFTRGFAVKDPCRGGRQPGGRAGPVPGRTFLFASASCRVEHAVRDGSAAARRSACCGGPRSGPRSSVRSPGPWASGGSAGPGGLLAGGEPVVTRRPASPWSTCCWRLSDLARTPVPGPGCRAGCLGRHHRAAGWVVRGWPGRLWAGLGMRVLPDRQPSRRLGQCENDR